MEMANARRKLKGFEFQALFIEELGWDRHGARLDVNVPGADAVLTALAQKRGMVAYHCPARAGDPIPDYATRRRVEQQAAKAAHEHLIIFTDAQRTTQIWQWVKREPGKPTACREHTFHASQNGDALLQKLQAIAFSLDEEESLTLTDVTSRAKAGFDVERITKRFYDRFQKEHAAFLKFIAGITEKGDREWYASVMLNRLMFVYFIQRKGFLDGDRDYLRNRLARMRTEHGKDKFYSFYRYFLLRLFHEGLGGRKRSPELETLVGRIPYLNGGLFDIHELERSERYGKTIEIPDTAFERIFNYFDQYQWHLDERPLRADNEINPDVLGYIFEKYINQKQMGAYYTKEDITEYITKNTVLPFLFDAARPKCRIAFENPSGPTVWDLLRNEPDRYIHAAVRHGTDVSLPADIAIGIDPPSLHQPVGADGPVAILEARKDWNRLASQDCSLPTETWREVVVRRRRYEALRHQLAAGDVRDIKDFVTLNLDIRQFAQDVIERCEGPELLRAFWHAIEKVTVLDPTCGSGAFLFAALNILEPLYEACLDRMQAFVEDFDRANEKQKPEKFSDFRRILANVAAHPNRRYFIFKSIILNNLYGVDIMEEAVEICKLRLFLKLAAQVEPDAAAGNLGIEPLPDIDFNIRAGNTLIGYASYDEVKAAVGGKLDLDNVMEKIALKAADLQQTFDTFRQRQIEGDGSVPTEHKQELRQRLAALEEELNHHLALEYGVKPKDRASHDKWLKSHQPFHWFIDFYGIMARGGFDVVVGNPPYVVYSPEKVAYTVKRTAFKTFDCKNLYALVTERSASISSPTACLGLIVQLTVLSSEKMGAIQQLLIRRGLFVASAFPRRPESVFDGVEMPVAILISQPNASETYTSRVSRFYTQERPSALNVLAYSNHPIQLHGHRIGKIGTRLELEIVRKLQESNLALASLNASSKHTIYYQEACRYWVKACKGMPFFRRNGESMPPPHGRTMSFTSDEAASFATCLLNSSFFYWFYSLFSDCEHINDVLIRTFIIPERWSEGAWLKHEKILAASLRQHSKRKTITTKQGHKIEYDELNAAQSKEEIDAIDLDLARHYKLTQEQLDFIINYDIKYRLGQGVEVEDE